MKEYISDILEGVLPPFTHNGRIYPKEAYENCLRELKLKIKKEIRKEKLEKINKLVYGERK